MRRNSADNIQRLKKMFLKTYPACFTITKTCEIAGINRSTFYEWLKDTEFQEQFSQAKDAAVELMEKEAHRRAYEGVEEPVFHVVDKELVQNKVRKFSDTLLIFLLKGGAPEKYRERQEITGKDGKALEIVVRWDGNKNVTGNPSSASTPPPG